MNRWPLTCAGNGSWVRAVVWSESAQRALDDVIEYIAKDSRPAAGHVLEAALDVAASLATLSERGRVVPEFNDPGIREVFVFRYRLMYRVEETRVLMVAFVTAPVTLLHGARTTTLTNLTQVNKALHPTPPASLAHRSRRG